MTQKSSLCLMLAFLSAPLPALSSGIEINLTNQTETVDSIQDEFGSTIPVFSLEKSTLNVMKGGSSNNTFLLYKRIVSVANGSTLNAHCSAEWHGGEYSFTDSALNVDGYLQLSEASSSEKAGKMSLVNSLAQIKGGVDLQKGAILTLKGNSSLVSEGTLTMQSGESQDPLMESSVLNLEGKDVSFRVKSVNINNYGIPTLDGSRAPSAKLNVNEASFIVEGQARFEGADINLQNGGEIKAGSIFSTNNSTMKMEKGTSIETQGSLAFNTVDATGRLIADGVDLTSKNGTISLSNIDSVRVQLTNSTLTAKAIELLAWKRKDATSSDFSSVTMKADSFLVTGDDSSSISISGTSSANFLSSDINERGRLIISQGASVDLGNTTIGSNAYGASWPAGDSGHLVIDGNDSVLAGTINLIRYAATLTVQNGGKITMGEATAGAGEACSVFVASGSSLTAEVGSVITLERGLIADSGSTLWSGETTGTESLTTTTGIIGDVTVRDGATLGSFVHDTGERVITKQEIVDSMKAGFSTGDGVTYLYQIGANVNMGTIAVENNEIISAGAGSKVSVGEILGTGYVQVTGGEVDVTKATAWAPVTIGSYNDGNQSNTTSASIKINADSVNQTTLKAEGGSGVFKIAAGETTVISSKVTIVAASLKVEEQGTLLINNGKINANVVVGDGSIIKGSGSYNGGLTLNKGSVFIVGNSPGKVILNGDTTISASQAVFSIAGTTAATASKSGWSSGAFSNIEAQSGSFEWVSGTKLTIEMAAAYAPTEGMELSFNLMKFILVDKNGNEGVTSLTMGSTNLLASASGSIEGIDIVFSDKSSVDGVALHSWLKDMELVYTTTESTTAGKYVTVSLKGVAGASPSVPEPSTAALGLLAFAGMLMRRSRRS